MAYLAVNWMRLMVFASSVCVRTARKYLKMSQLIYALYVLNPTGHLRLI